MTKIHWLKACNGEYLFFLAFSYCKLISFEFWLLVRQNKPFTVYDASGLF